jgi:DNA-binding MarR family transcriptional regulator
MTTPRRASLVPLLLAFAALLPTAVAGLPVEDVQLAAEPESEPRVEVQPEGEPTVVVQNGHEAPPSGSPGLVVGRAPEAPAPAVAAVAGGLGLALVGAAAIGTDMGARLLGGLLALFSRLRRDRLLDHATRARVYDAIEVDAGVGFRELRRRLGLSTGVLYHHLRMLERHELVRRRTHANRVQYYLAGTPPPPRPLSAAQARFVAALQGAPATRRELAHRLGLTPQAVGHLGRRLDALGIVQRTTHGRTLVFSLPTA